MKSELKQPVWLNPFYRISDYKALVWGVLGILLSTALCYLGKCHFHGLLHVGGAPNQAWWCFVAEHLIIWLVPAVAIYLLAIFCSKSHVRPIDVLGTISFAQIPLVFLSAIMLMPAMQEMNAMTTPDIAELQAIISDPDFVTTMIITGVGSILLLSWTLVWMFKATAVACNLKGGRLWAVYLIGVLGGEVVVRYLIGLCY